MESRHLSTLTWAFLALLLLHYTPAITATFDSSIVGDNEEGEDQNAPNSQTVNPNFLDWIMQHVKQHQDHLQAQLMDYSDGSSGGGLDTELQAAENGRKSISVTKDGSGDFGTIQDAIDSIPAGNTDRYIIKIQSGSYHEQVSVPRTKPFITFHGVGSEKPVITYGATSAQKGMVNSATVAIDGDYFIATKIIFQNSAPKPRPGSQGGQAVALRLNGNKAAIYDCELRGYQDTLYDERGLHYFKNCLIQGTVDFIFGDGTTLYDNCQILSVADAIGDTYIVAQGRDSPNDQGGFSFVHCKVTGSGRAALARPWRGYARVVFAYTYMDSVVSPQGWSAYGSNPGNLYYGEYQCDGPGSSRTQRMKNSATLTSAQAQPFLTTSFINGKSWLLAPSGI